VRRFERTTLNILALCIVLIAGGCTTTAAISAKQQSSSAASPDSAVTANNADQADQDTSTETGPNGKLAVLDSGAESPAGGEDVGDSATTGDDTSDAGSAGAGAVAALGLEADTGDLSTGSADDLRAALETEGEITELQRRIVVAAEEVLATQNFVVDGYRYTRDCTGTVLNIYARAGVRLIDLFPNYTGNGVHCLYGIAEDYELLYQTYYPEPGDLIFWDNTYDKDGDGEWDDGLTHVGLVLNVDEDGTVEYVHYHYTGGVVRAHMNLLQPETHIDSEGVEINSPMRMRSHRYLNPSQWLASHLFRVLAAMYQIDL
jgi:hypothetical protein